MASSAGLDRVRRRAELRSALWAKEAALDRAVESARERLETGLGATGGDALLIAAGQRPRVVSLPARPPTSPLPRHFHDTSTTLPRHFLGACATILPLPRRFVDTS